MRQLVIVFAALLAGLSVHGQVPEYSFLTLPPDLPKATHEVIREHELRYEMADAGHGSIYERQVVTILREEGRGYEQLAAFYDKDSKVREFYLAAYDQFGQEIDVVKKGKAEDYLYNDRVSFLADDRVMVAKVYCTSYPCTVVRETRKDVANSNLMGFPAWSPQRYNAATVKSSFTVVLPSDNDLLYQLNRLPEPTKTSEGGFDTYHWSVSDLPVVLAEPYAPPYTDALPYARIVPRRVEIEGRTVDYSDWQGFAAFNAGLYRDRQELPAALRAEVHELTDGLTSDREKITALYKFMQERMRYVGIQLGIGGWQPFPADYVEENRFGDCKALTNYLMAMLAEAGVASNPVVIYWGDQQYRPKKDFATNTFNHVLLYAPSEDMYMECTSNLSPAGYLGSGKYDRNALLLTETGGDLVRMPPALPETHGITRTSRITLDTDGNATVNLHAEYRGSEQENLRRFHQEAGGNESKLRESLHARDYLPDVTGTHFELSIDPDRPVVTLDYETTRPRYARKMGSRMFIPLAAALASPVPVPDPVDERHLPVDFDEVGRYTDEVLLDLPDNLRLESGADGETTTLENEIGTYVSTITNNGDGTLTWSRTLTLRKAQLPAAEYDAMRKFLVEANKQEGIRVVAKVEKTK